MRIGGDSSSPQKEGIAMLKYVRETSKIYHKGKVIKVFGKFRIIDESIPETETLPIEWNTLEESLVMCYLIVSKVRKGLKIKYYTERFLPTVIKQWKEPYLDMILKINRIEIAHPSISDILQYPDGNLAAQYIKEHFYE